MKTIYENAKNGYEKGIEGAKPCVQIHEMIKQ